MRATWHVITRGFATLGAPRLVPALVLAISATAAVAVVSALAENIDPANDNSQFAWGENVGWINAEPAGGMGLTVTGSKVLGYMWGENIGWINMHCENRNTCGDVEYGVLNDGDGNLSGQAWAENVGWISFRCVEEEACGFRGFGVQVDPATGIFSGSAWGENIGWITFSDDAPVAYAVRTDDGDGVPGAGDLCPFDSDASQLNTDNAPLTTPDPTPPPNDTTIANSDLRGNACDEDDDNDLIPDSQEASGCNGSGPLSPTNADTDGDRVRDGAECALGSNPASAASKPAAAPFADTDGDGLSDALEQRGYSTSATQTNTDGDICPDDIEVASVNGDTVVSALDLIVISQRFFRTDRPVQDVNKDGSITALDLSLVAQNFQLTPCS